MADVEKVQMLVNQCKQILKDHPEDPEDATSFIVNVSVFHDELKFIIKALEQFKDQLEFEELEVIK